MRLPFPERISLLYALSFAGLLAIAQLLEGTSALFTLCSFLFILIATLTFNAAGGFTRTSGSYVFFYAVLGVIVGLCWKAILGEPADSNLFVPILTISVYLGGISAMFVAVYLSRKLTTRRALLGDMLAEANVQNATIGCMVTGILISFLTTAFSYSNGSVLSALQQLDRFLPMAIILGVSYQIRKSGGTSSINLPVLISFAALFIGGVIGFSKEGMITPFFCWLVAACSLRYRVSGYQIVGGILTGVFIFQILVPYSQYGRDFQTRSLSSNFDVAVSLLSNMSYVRQQYAAMSEDSREAAAWTYYNTPQGFFDRLQMIAPDDSLIAFTEQRGTFGLLPLVLSFENVVPHVFWPNKPTIISGNFYMHEMGRISEEDNSTGIAFTPTGEAYHLARWTGVLIIAPVLWMILFIIFDSLCGDVRKSPWGLIVLVVFSHVAPEGLLTGIVYMYFYTTFTVVVTALSVSYIMPLIGTLLAGPEGIALRRRRPIRSFPRRIESSSRAEGIGS